MTPEIMHDAPTPMLWVFERARELWDALPILPRGTTCHALCRALARPLALQVIDGYFVRSHSHAWLVNPRHPGWLIDLYPWASLGGPRLVSVEPMSPWAGLYRPADQWLTTRLYQATGEPLPDLLRGLEEAKVAVGAIVPTGVLQLH